MSLLRAKEAAAKLDISVRYLWTLVDKGDLTYIKLGETRRGARFDPDDITKLIESKRCQSRNSPTETIKPRLAGVRKELDEMLGPCAKPNPLKLVS